MEQNNPLNEERKIKCIFNDGLSAEFTIKILETSESFKNMFEDITSINNQINTPYLTHNDFMKVLPIMQSISENQNLKLILFIK
jgi:hypothetical protein